MSQIENFRDPTADFTFAELYEDKHNRIDLRNKISNALMAISLYEVRSRSRNLPKYIVDGLNLSSASSESLRCLMERCEKHNHEYVLRVLKDMLTNKGTAPITEEKYEKYKVGFEMVNKLFNAINDRREIEKERALEVKNFLMTFDRDIQMAYEKEDSLYFGYFRRIPARV